MSPKSKEQPLNPARHGCTDSNDQSGSVVAIGDSVSCAAELEQARKRQQRLTNHNLHQRYLINKAKPTFLSASA